MKKKINIVIWVLIFILLLIFNIWEKYKAIEISYDIQKLVNQINSLEEERKDILLQKIRLESYSRIQSIAENNLQMIDIKERNMTVLPVEYNYEKK